MEIERSSFERPWSEYHFSEDIKKTNISKNWVYLKNDNVVAYLFGWIIQKEYYLNNIAVSAELRRQGIGRNLIKTMIKFVKNDGVNQILLEVMQKNTTAIHLYEKLGFKAFGERTDNYTKGQHAVCYKLDLNNG